MRKTQPTVAESHYQMLNDLIVGLLASEMVSSVSLDAIPIFIPADSCPWTDCSNDTEHP